MLWKHPGPGYYCNKNFRIFKEGSKWWLSDIRNGTKEAPPWWDYTAKACMEKAKTIIRKSCGEYHE